MKQFVALTIVFLWILMPVEVFAKEKGRGMGRGQSDATRAEKVGEEVGEEVIDTVADELTGKPEPTAKGLPPGLAKKGKLPPGLEKQGKIPPGWEKGRKEGWDKSASVHTDSGVRRLIRGIFRKAKESP